MLLSVVVSLSLAGIAQQGLPESPQPQSAAQQALPNEPAPNRPLAGTPASPSEQVKAPSGEASSTDTAAESAKEDATPPPVPLGRVVPSNRVANTPSSGYDEVSGIIRVNVNAVPVTVTVKDARGRLFPGLTKENFSVYENGVKQRINFFSSDPFPVSAAIVIDVGMAEIALRKVKDTFSALVGSFSQFDELSIYTFGNTVKQQQDYLAALGDTTTQTLTRIEQLQGKSSGPIAYNPMTVGPSVNGRVFDPGTQRNPIDTAPPKSAEPSRVLNDALLQAALDLGHRPKARRRVIFIVSDGREDGSRASYSDVKKVLETNNVIVYGVEVDAGAIKGYDKLSKIRLPRQGYNNVLAKYASATGGEIFREFTKEALESAYGNAMEEGRSQYTLVYNSDATKSTAFRWIEVRVNGYGSSLKVYTRDGYYPTPQK
ncbi:MAG: VWA domain-containing protein [Candidatus Korobacteraceae bacterium]|jgi:VWFA-related protein